MLSVVNSGLADALVTLSHLEGRTRNAMQTYKAANAHLIVFAAHADSCEASDNEMRQRHKFITLVRRKLRVYHQQIVVVKALTQKFGQMDRLGKSMLAHQERYGEAMTTDLNAIKALTVGIKCIDYVWDDIQRHLKPLKKSFAEDAQEKVNSTVLGVGGDEDGYDSDATITDDELRPTAEAPDSAFKGNENELSEAIDGLNDASDRSDQAGGLRAEDREEENIAAAEVEALRHDNKVAADDNEHDGQDGVRTDAPSMVQPNGAGTLISSIATASNAAEVGLSVIFDKSGLRKEGTAQSLQIEEAPPQEKTVTEAGAPREAEEGEGDVHGQEAGNNIATPTSACSVESPPLDESVVQAGLESPLEVQARKYGEAGAGS